MYRHLLLFCSSSLHSTALQICLVVLRCSTILVLLSSETSFCTAKAEQSSSNHEDAGRLSSASEQYESPYWRHLPQPQPNELGDLQNKDHTALRNPIREETERFRKEWQTPMEYLKEAHTNFLTYPNFFCFPPGSEYSFFRCCLPKLATRDCWGRKLHFGSVNPFNFYRGNKAFGRRREHVADEPKHEEATADVERDTRSPRRPSSRHAVRHEDQLTAEGDRGVLPDEKDSGRAWVEKAVHEDAKRELLDAVSDFLHAVEEDGPLHAPGDDHEHRHLKPKKSYVYQRIFRHLERRLLPQLRRGGPSEKIPESRDEINVDDIVAYFNQTDQDVQNFLADGGLKRVKQRRFEVTRDNEKLIHRLEGMFGLNVHDTAAVPLAFEWREHDGHLLRTTILERLKNGGKMAQEEIGGESRDPKNGAGTRTDQGYSSTREASATAATADILRTSPDLCCHHTQQDETSLTKWQRPLLKLRTKASLFECLSALADFHVRTLAVSFAQRNDFIGPYLNGFSLGFYQDIQKQCEHWYILDKAALYAASEASYLRRVYNLADVGQLRSVDEKDSAASASQSEDRNEIIDAETRNNLRDKETTDLQPLSTTAGVRKPFGVVSSCVESTLQHCSLTMSFWQCYTMLHAHNTELFYEAAYDYDLHLHEVTCLRGANLDAEASLRGNQGDPDSPLQADGAHGDEDGAGSTSESGPPGEAAWDGKSGSAADSSHTTRSTLVLKHQGAHPPAQPEDPHACIRNSPLCRLVFDGLVSRWRAKPRAVLHAFGQYEWVLAVDAADTSIGPGCFLRNLEEIFHNPQVIPEEAEVVVKDPSNQEDSNGGVFAFKGRSRFGKLFVDLINDKDNWPGELIGGGCYPEQMAMNEALLELAALETGIPYNSECLKYIFGMPGENGVFGCQFNTHITCFRHFLETLAGPFGQRRTRKVFFLNPRLVDLNFRPYGNVPMNDTKLVHDGEKNSPFLWHWVNYDQKKPFILKHMLGIEDENSEEARRELDEYAIVDEGTAKRHFIASPQWCQRVIRGPLSSRKTARDDQQGVGRRSPTSSSGQDSEDAVVSSVEDGTGELAKTPGDSPELDLEPDEPPDVDTCTFGSPEPVCQHLPHQYISQC
ncbi:unnamed protein product [Amoebophrya sp. A120]|nr:unnamed protein product [Amoebophrya sp. A120]|eukprot:GSA120T00006008001.1